MIDAMGKIIFIGGIHGVGKTLMCKRLEERKPVSHYSAGQLIMELKDEKLDGTDKTVKDINGNQDLLISAIEKYVSTDSLALLDGHFCLLNANNEVKRIPIETFRRIAPRAIIVLFDSVENILRRISGRDGVSYDYQLMSYFQDEEINYARYVAKCLNVPYFKADVSEQVAEVDQFIDSLSLVEVKK